MSDTVGLEQSSVGAPLPLSGITETVRSHEINLRIKDLLQQIGISKQVTTDTNGIGGSGWHQDDILHRTQPRGWTNSPPRLERRGPSTCRRGTNCPRRLLRVQPPVGAYLVHTKVARPVEGEGTRPVRSSFDEVKVPIRSPEGLEVQNVTLISRAQ